MTQKKSQKTVNKKPVKRKIDPRVTKLKELRKKRNEARKKLDALEAVKKKRRDKIVSILEKNTYSSDAEEELIHQLKLKDHPLLQKIISVLLVSRDRARDVMTNFDEEIINVLQMETNPDIQVARKEWANLEDAIEDLESKIDDEELEEEEKEIFDDDCDDCDDDIIDSGDDDDIDEGGPDHEGEP